MALTRKPFALSGRGIATTAVLVAAIIWSTSFAVTKVLLDRVPPLTIGAIRFTAAALVLAVAVRFQPGWRRPPFRAIVGMGASGLLGITAYFAIENIGVDFATASDATLIVASHPILTLLIETLLRQARITAVKLGGMLLAVAGVWLVVQHGAGASGTNRLLGDLILVSGGAVWASYNIMARRSGARHSTLTVTYYQTCAGAIGFLALAPLERDRWQPFSGGDLLSLAYLAVFCSIVAFLLYNRGLRDLPSATAVNLLNLVPLFGLVAAVLLAGESISLVQVVGGFVVVSGVVLGMGEFGAKASRAGGVASEDRRSAADLGDSDAPATAARTGGEHGAGDNQKAGRAGEWIGGP